MPKVRGSIKDVSTSFVPVEPDTYIGQISKAEYKQEDGREFHTITTTIINGEETGSKNAGRTIRDQISMHQKDGEENEIGLITLKRYIEAVFPESKKIGEEGDDNFQEGWTEEEWDEFDTDQLVGHSVELVVIIEPDKKDPEKKYNRIKRLTAA